MNRFLKALALIAAVVMSLSVLAACGDNKTDKPLVSGDSAQNPPADNGGSANTDGEVEHIIPTLTIDGKSIDISDNPVILTIGGVEIRFDEYRYMYKIYESYYAMYNGITADMWEGNEENFQVFKDELRDALIERNYGNIVGKKFGLEFDDEDNEQIEVGLENERAQFETEEKFQEALDLSGLQEDLLRRLVASGIMDNKVYALYVGENARFRPTDDEVRKHIKENYSRVYHLLISNEHFSESVGYEDYTEEELKTAAKELAEEMLEQINSGKDTIYNLAQTVGDDPGMKDNTDGYMFTYGEMVPEFEEASFALEVGEKSGLVESDYGYHIIEKLELDQFIEDNFEGVRELCENSIFNSEVNKILAEAEIVYSEYYDGISYDSIT